MAEPAPDHPAPVTDPAAADHPVLLADRPWLDPRSLQSKQHQRHPLGEQLQLGVSADWAAGLLVL